MDGLARTGSIMVGHRPPCVYLMSLHGTRSPSLPPPYLHTANDQTLHGSGNGLGTRLQNGLGRGYRMAWERGHRMAWDEATEWPGNEATEWPGTRLQNGLGRGYRASVVGFWAWWDDNEGQEGTKWSILSEQYELKGPLNTPCTVHSVPWRDYRQDKSLQRHLELKSAGRSLSLSLSLGMVLYVKHGN